MSSSVFWRSMKTVQRCRQKVSHSRLEVQPLRRLDRRLFSVWNAGRPLCDSTQIGVACQYCVGEQGSRSLLAPLLYHQPTTNSIKRDEAPIQVLRIVTLSQTNSIHCHVVTWQWMENVDKCQHPLSCHCWKQNKLPSIAKEEDKLLLPCKSPTMQALTECSLVFLILSYSNVYATSKHFPGTFALPWQLRMEAG